MIPVVNYLGEPKSAGERWVFDTLKTTPAGGLNLWLGLDCLPGVPDIDALVYHPLCGLVLLEIKGVGIESVREYGFNHCLIEGRQPDRGPVNQAARAFEGLRRYLGQFFQGRALPFIAVTACWPYIRRNDWNCRWSEPAVTDDYSERMLFRDDFEGGPDKLLSRLSSIRRAPPWRSSNAAWGKPEITGAMLNDLRSKLSPIARPIPTESEQTRLAKLEERLRRDLHSRYPPGGSHKVLFSGYPGTGKTFRLLQIGLWHASNGMRVLYSCFNKVLGADIRRLLQLYSLRNPIVGNQIDVVDVFEPATQVMKDYGVDTSAAENHDEWGEMIADDLQGRANANMNIYDTVLIDESQDMSEWQVRLLLAHARGGADVFAAHGRGQELYPGRSDESYLASEFEQSRLNRNFRNARRIYFSAHAFYEAYPDKEAGIERAADQFLRGRGGENVRQELIFDIEGSGGPRLRYTVPTPEGDQVNQTEFMALQYREILEQELVGLGVGARVEPVDVLVLVPNKDSTNAQWARLALEAFCKGRDYSFIDYTKEGARRVSPGNSQIRLCTFHSARGLEASRVIVFGFEVVNRCIAGENVDLIRNLGFIILSRAVREAVLVIRPELRSLKPVSLLEKILAVEA